MENREKTEPPGLSRKMTNAPSKTSNDHPDCLTPAYRTKYHLAGIELLVPYALACFVNEQEQNSTVTVSSSVYIKDNKLSKIDLRASTSHQLMSLEFCKLG